MPRLPTREEADQQAAVRLAKLSADLHWSDVVFKDIERILDEVPRQAARSSPDDIWHRVRFADAVAKFCSGIRDDALPADALMKKAKRLVMRVRRDINELKTRRDQNEQSLAAGKARLREAGLDCLAPYQSAKVGVEYLRGLAGGDLEADTLLDDPQIAHRCSVLGWRNDWSPPEERLARAVEGAREACWEVQPPFRFANCEAALAILDEMLGHWGETTRSTRRQRRESKQLNDLIFDLSGAFEKATGTRAVDAPDRFKTLLNRLLTALPADVAEVAKYAKHSEGALAKRSLRVRSKKNGN